MSDALPQIPSRWDGESFTPLNQHWARRADAAYTVGEIYNLAPVEERSPKSHAHFFAEVAEAWHQLPEHLSEAYPSPEALRKFALIKAGFCDAHPFVCSSRAEALRFASYIKPVDAYAVVTVKEAVVTRYTAQSQSLKAMGKADFQRSKQAVLEIVAEMIGVSSSDLSREAGRMVA
jgi:UDP-N-acetylmuramyl pentapeptide synthase